MPCSQQGGRGLTAVRHQECSQLCCSSQATRSMSCCWGTRGGGVAACVCTCAFDRRLTVTTVHEQGLCVRGCAVHACPSARVQTQELPFGLCVGGGGATAHALRGAKATVTSCCEVHCWMDGRGLEGRSMDCGLRTRIVDQGRRGSGQRRAALRAGPDVQFTSAGEGSPECVFVW